MNTLYLTADEKKLYDALSDDLKEGWETEEETITFEDTDELRQLRIDLMEVSSPVTKDIQEKAQGKKTMQEAAEALKDYDLTNLSEDDMWEVFFALGPDTVTSMIEKLFVDVKEDKDVENISTFSIVRHELLTNLSS